MPEAMKIVTGVLLLIIAIIIVFNVVGATAPSLTEAGDNISDSVYNNSDNTATRSLPLRGLFSGTGVIFLLFMAGILLVVITLIIKQAKM